MQATDILMSEHRVIERVIASLEIASNRLEAGQDIRTEFFLDAADFIQGFADGCHHKKEEGVLFKTLGEYGLSAERGPVAVMLLEHQQGRQFTQAMRAAAQRVQAGDRSAIADIIRSAKGYAQLLKQHITKEDGMLFPMAGKFIPVSEHAKVVEGFEHIEHAETGEGVHEKYLALAEALEREMVG